MTYADAVKFMTHVWDHIPYAHSEGDLYNTHEILFQARRIMGSPEVLVIRNGQVFPSKVGR